MIALFWLQVALEISGGILTFRRRLGILFAYMAFSAVADIALYAIKDIHPLYGYSSWAAEALQYGILFALGVQLASKMVQDYRPQTRFRYMAIAVAASVVTYIFVVTQMWEQKFLFAEAVSSFLLLAVVLLGWIGRKKGLEEPWGLITAGVILSSAGNASCAVMSAQWPLALRLYPIPAIAALLLWNFAAIYRKKEPMRVNPSPKFEPSSVQAERRVQRFVM